MVTPVRLKVGLVLTGRLALFSVRGTVLAEGDLKKLSLTLQRNLWRNFRSQEMIRPMSPCRVVHLTIVLLAGAALMTIPDIANAKGNNHGNNHQGSNPRNNSANPRFVISGQPVNVKRVLRDHKIKGASNNCSKMNCDKPMQAATKANPKFVVSGQPVNAKKVLRHHKDKGAKNDCKNSSCDKRTEAKGNPAQPAPIGNAPPNLNTNGTGGTVTISNGVTTSAIFNGNGLTVTSSDRGKITVTNTDHSSVTMNGGSLTLSGAISAKVGPGMEVYRHPNGDLTFAIKPAAGGAPVTGTKSPPPGVTVTDTLKASANFYASIVAVPAVSVAGVVMLPAALIVGAVEGHPLKSAGEFLGDYAVDAVNWATSLF